MSPEKQRLTFLSYSRINKDFALQLARELKSSGFNVWIDQIDIPTGARWDDELEKALEECEVFMVILTPASSASDNVKDEIGYAIDTNKRILPILLENANVPLRLRRFQYVDFTGKTYGEGVEGAKQQLRKLIVEPTIPQSQLSPVEQAQKAESDRQKKEKIVANKVETARKEKEAAVPKVAPTPAKSEKPTPTAPPPAVSKPVIQPEPAKVEPVSQSASLVVQPVSQPVPATTASTPTPSQPVQKKALSKPLMIGLGVGALAIMAVYGIVGVSLLGGGGEDSVPVAAEVVSEDPAIIPETGGETISEEVAPDVVEETVPISGPVVLNASEAEDLYWNSDIPSLRRLAKDVYSEEELSNLLDNEEMIEIELSSPQPILVIRGWAAMTPEILDENLQYIDDEAIPEENIVHDYFETEDGWYGVWAYAVVDNWSSGEYAILQELSINSPINDGEYDYEPDIVGDYYYVIVP